MFSFQLPFSFFLVVLELTEGKRMSLSEVSPGGLISGGLGWGSVPSDLVEGLRWWFEEIVDGIFDDASRGASPLLTPLLLSGMDQYSSVQYLLDRKLKHICWIKGHIRSYVYLKVNTYLNEELIYLAIQPLFNGTLVIFHMYFSWQVKGFLI